MQKLHRKGSQRTGSMHSCVLRDNLAGVPTITEFSGTSFLITAPIHIKQSLPTVTPPWSMGHGAVR
jgi:hypothetical protein